MRLLCTALILATLVPGCEPEDEGSNAAPVFSLRSPQLAPAAVPVTFDASASSDDRGIVLFRAQFGDGSREAEFSSAIFTHVFEQPGRFELAFTAIDAAGKRDSLVRAITVVERYWPPYCTEELPCEGAASCEEGECFFDGGREE